MQQNVIVQPKVQPVEIIDNEDDSDEELRKVLEMSAWEAREKQEFEQAVAFKIEESKEVH